MGYKETSEQEDEENLDEIAADLSLGEDDELSFDEDGENDNSGDGEFTEAVDGDALLDAELILSAKKAKNQPKTFSLQARRAIEDHLEQRRLRKELDYLFDDKFANGEEAGKK